MTVVNIYNDFYFHAFMLNYYPNINYINYESDLFTVIQWIQQVN